MLGIEQEMRFSAAYEVLCGILNISGPTTCLLGVARTIVDGEVSTVTSLSLSMLLCAQGGQDSDDVELMLNVSLSCIEPNACLIYKQMRTQPLHTNGLRILGMSGVYY